MKFQSRFRSSLLLLCLFFYLSPSHAQEGKVWVTIPIKKVPKIIEGKLTSDNAAFNKAIHHLNIYSVEKALPSSRSLKLQQVYEITCNCDEVDLYTTLTNDVGVLSGVEYAPKYETLDIPNDYTPLLYSSSYALDLINAPAAWDITHGDPNVYVAISDQNYFPNHPDLVDKIIYYDASNTSSGTHGTAVAISAAGATNNSYGIASIGYDTKLALYGMYLDEVLAASYAGAKVINMSWTNGCAYSQYNQDVINEVYNNGTFLVASAGNGSTCNGPETLVYPASFENVFSVTSVGPNNNHQQIIGNPNSTHQHNAQVDLSAPGYNVLVSPAPGWNLFASGTSYAAPFVTGTIGLMLAVNPNLSNDDIEIILKSSSYYIDDVNPSYAGNIGAGRLDAQAAVAMAVGYSNCNLTVDAGDNQTLYYGYQPTECVSLSGLVTDGTAPYTFEWVSNSGNYGGQDVIVCPENSDTYTLTVTDANGCSASDDIEVCVINVECQVGNSGNMKVEMCQIPPGNPNNAHTICINESAVPAHLAIGCTLGSCDEQNDCDGNSGMSEPGATNKANVVDLALTAFPNPTKNTTSISLTLKESGEFRVVLTDMTGRAIARIYDGLVREFENMTFEVNMAPLNKGVYLLNIIGSNGVIENIKLFKD